MKVERLGYCTNSNNNKTYKAIQNPAQQICNTEKVLPEQLDEITHQWTENRSTLWSRSWKPRCLIKMASNWRKNLFQEKRNGSSNTI